MLKEMAYAQAMDLIEKRLAARQITLTVCYDVENLEKDYDGPVETDFYGRTAPKHAHGSRNLSAATASAREIVKAAEAVFDAVTDKTLTIRRMYLAVTQVCGACGASAAQTEQISLFDDAQDKIAREEKDQKEKQRQLAVLDIQKRYGKNALIRGMNLEEGATAIQRNRQIGGHKA